MKLGEEQRQAVERARRGESICITGPAGTGKSEVLRALVSALRADGRAVAVTASTGVAAFNVEGATLHSFLGVKWPEGFVEGVWPVLNDEARARVRAPSVLVVDEVSMISGQLLDAVDQHLSIVRDDDAPFGGLQVIVVGDFLQLPPIEKRARQIGFAFEASAWGTAAFGVAYLSRNFRQGSGEFESHLGGLRLGKVPPSSRDFFAPCVGRALSFPTSLYALKKPAADENARRLAELPGEETRYSAETTCTTRCPGCGGAKDMYGEPCKEIAKRLRDFPGESVVALKPDARVICLRNDPNLGIVNGTTGFVRSCSEGSVLVRTDDGPEVALGRAEWTAKNESGDTVGTISQIPVKLAWALTIHKAQGLTLDRVQADLRRTWECGHSYVAVSRCRTVGGLSLAEPIWKTGARADPRAVEWDEEQRSAAGSAAGGANR